MIFSTHEPIKISTAYPAISLISSQCILIGILMAPPAAHIVESSFSQESRHRVYLRLHLMLRNVTREFQAICLGQSFGQILIVWP